MRATPSERARPLPGDDILTHSVASLTHAVTVDRPPVGVWPWLVQMGAGRAGWYSYDFIDNGRRASLRRIAPELQEIEIGSVLPAAPGVSEGFIVLSIEPERTLVIGWPGPDGVPITTWAFVLEPTGPGRTRLLVRVRAGSAYRPPFGLPAWSARTLVSWGHAIMQRKQLLGIKERAEAGGANGWDLRGVNAPDGTDHDPVAGVEPGPWIPAGRFIPAPDHAARHETLVHAPAKLVLAVAHESDMRAHPLVRAIFRLREVLLRSSAVAPRQSVGLVEETTRLGWGILCDAPGRGLVMGAVTQPWQADVTFRSVSPDRFASFSEPGLVKIVWTLEVEPLGPALTRFSTETRTLATDENARGRFQRYWRIFSVGILSIRVLLLPRIRRDAERRFREGRGR